MYSVEISHKSGKMVETKSQKVFWANSYVYRGKTGEGTGEIGLMLKAHIMSIIFFTM